MYQKKSTPIELGGPNIPLYYRKNSITPLQSNISSPSTKNSQLSSKEIIISSHQIPLKISPTKPKIQQTSGFRRQPSENDTSFSEMQYSMVSHVSDGKEMLLDRSNLNSQAW
jgi:hypothetical protein